MLIKHLPQARYYLLDTQFLIKSSQQAKSYYYSHSPDEEAKAQRGYITYPSFRVNDMLDFWIKALNH